MIRRVHPVAEMPLISPNNVRPGREGLPGSWQHHVLAHSTVECRRSFGYLYEGDQRISAHIRQVLNVHTCM